MNLETITTEETNSKGLPAKDYLPFGMNYAEVPETRGYQDNGIYAYTSVTFCTFKWIPLVDDGD